MFVFSKHCSRYANRWSINPPFCLNQSGSHTGVGTGIPIPWDPSPNPKFWDWDWDWDRFFRILGLGLGLGSIFQNFGIGIGLGITNSGQNPKKSQESQEIPKVVVEISVNLISMNYLLFFFRVKVFDCQPLFKRSRSLIF